MMALFPDCTCRHGFFKHLLASPRKCREQGCPCENYEAAPIQNADLAGPGLTPTTWHPTITKAEVQQLHDTIAAISPLVQGDPVHAKEKLDALAGQLQTLLGYWT